MDGKGNYIYEFGYSGNYDGDSIRGRARKRWDFGFNLHIIQTADVNVRLKGVDTPEMNDDRPDFKAAAILAKDAVHCWFNLAGKVTFLSLDKPDKYGRSLGDFRNDAGERLSAHLLDARLGVKYEGQNKDDVQAAHERNIAWLKKEGSI